MPTATGKVTIEDMKSLLGSYSGHHNPNGESGHFEQSPYSAYVGPSQHISYGETGQDERYDHTDADFDTHQTTTSFPSSPGPHQPTAQLQFPVTSNYETLHQWGYVVYSVLITEPDGRSKEYQKIMYTGDGDNRGHHVAQVRISADDELVVSMIDTENIPGLSRPRTRASNILLAFWTGSNREITTMRGLRFENVIEETTREDAGPQAYEMLGLPLYQQKLKIGRELRGHAEVFRYIAEHSRLARMVWSMLQCQEMREANVQIVEFYFCTFVVKSRFIDAAFTPFHFEIRLSAAQRRRERERD
ncbi:hypothetical protein N0V82_003673 [Gnomoniopsis sp. IMI 355080]|nr:hypothetical protein N0V82_003673 [Gnomoniopsis sp. IMI 355080]